MTKLAANFCKNSKKRQSWPPTFTKIPKNKKAGRQLSQKSEKTRKLAANFRKNLKKQESWPLISPKIPKNNKAGDLN